MQCINGNDNVHNMLNKFSAGLNSGKYTKRLDYNIWRYLKKATQITIGYNNRNINVHALMPDNYIYNSYFNYNDCGFGQFLADNYILMEDQEGRDIILKHNNNAITSAKSNDQLGAITYATSDDWLDNSSISVDTTYTTGTTSNVYFNGNSINTSTIGAYSPNSVTVDGEKFVTKEEFYKEKEEDTMDTKKIFGSTFDFGSCGDTVRMSIYGLTVKTRMASGSVMILLIARLLMSRYLTLYKAMIAEMRDKNGNIVWPY